MPRKPKPSGPPAGNSQGQRGGAPANPSLDGMGGGAGLPHVPGYNPGYASSGAGDRFVSGEPMGVHVAVAPFNDRFAVRVGSGLTPQRVTGILKQADLGYMWQLADLLDEVRETDPHLHSVLQKREWQVAGAPWDMRPPEDSGKDGDEIANICKAKLRRLRGFAGTIAHLQGGVYHGRSGLENVWWIDPEDGLLVPRALLPIHPRRWAYATDWRLHLWDQTSPSPTPQFGAYPGVPIDSFPRGKFIIHTPRIMGGYPTREGLGRLLTWFACFKRWTWRDWMAYAEFVGRPLRVGTYSTGQGGKDGLGPGRASPADKAVLDSAIDNISGAVGVSLPDNVKLAIEQASRSNNVHEVLSGAINAEMSKAVLGETLTTEAGTRGARSLGEVHDEIRMMIARGDAQAIAETLYFDLLVPMVEMNFGKGAPVPEIEFKVTPKQSKDSIAKQILDGVEAGIKLSQNDARAMLEWPDPSDGDDLVEPLRSAPGIKPDEPAPAPSKGKGKAKAPEPTK